MASSRDKKHAGFRTVVLTHSGAKREGGVVPTPTPCVVKGGEMASAGEG